MASLLWTEFSNGWRYSHIIHNFDLKRLDGTTAAQRLYDYNLPDLFE